MAAESSLSLRRWEKILRPNTHFSVTKQIIHAKKILNADWIGSVFHTQTLHLFFLSTVHAKTSTNRNLLCGADVKSVSEGVSSFSAFQSSSCLTCDKVLVASWAILVCCCTDGAQHLHKLLKLQRRHPETYQELSMVWFCMTYLSGRWNSSSLSIRITAGGRGHNLTVKNLFNWRGLLSLWSV